MEDRSTILLNILPLDTQGHLLMGDRWDGFLSTLRASLQRLGEEDLSGGPSLLRFLFPDPELAFQSIFRSLDEICPSFGWTDRSECLPLLLLFDLSIPDALIFPSVQANSPYWDVMDPEIPHVTHSLQQRWPRLVPDGVLPGISFGPERAGIHRVEMSGTSGKRARALFPSRHLLLSGDHPPCFYCGMTQHTPATCPTRFLSPEVHGLSLVGRTPLLSLNDSLSRAIPRMEELQQIFTAGLTASELAHTPELLAAATYFDLYRIYQHRFLLYMCSSYKAGWPGIGKPTSARGVEGTNLHLALDCLRVGKYDKAREILLDKGRLVGGGPFYSTVTLAFLALEEISPQLMVARLEDAVPFAESDEEQMWIHLLLSRALETMGDLSAAEDEAQIAYSIKSFCQEPQYRRIQLAARNSLSDRHLAELKKLVTGDDHYLYMALMDPALTPSAPTVDKIVIATYQALFGQARAAASRALEQSSRLLPLLEEDDPQVNEIQSEGETLRSQLGHGGYQDLLEVVDRAQKLEKKCRVAILHVNNRILAELSEIWSVWKELLEFWQNYTMQPIYPDYPRGLNDTSRVLQDLNQKIHTGALNSRREVGEALEETRSRLNRLKTMQGKMQKARNTYLFFKRFWRLLLVFEFIAVFITFLALPVLPYIFPEETNHVLNALETGSMGQIRLLYILCVIVSPAMAGLFALRYMLRTK